MVSRDLFTTVECKADKETPWEKSQGTQTWGQVVFFPEREHLAGVLKNGEHLGRPRMFQTGATSKSSLHDLQPAPHCPGPPGGEGLPLRGSPGLLLGPPVPNMFWKGERGHRPQVPPRNSEASGSLPASLSLSQAKQLLGFQGNMSVLPKVHLGSERHHSILCPGAWIVPWRPILATQL